MSRALFLTLRVASPSRAPRQAQLEVLFLFFVFLVPWSWEGDCFSGVSSYFWASGVFGLYARHAGSQPVLPVLEFLVFIKENLKFTNDCQALPNPQKPSRTHKTLGKDSENTKSTKETPCLTSSKAIPKESNKRKEREVTWKWLQVAAPRWLKNESKVTSSPMFESFPYPKNLFGLFLTFYLARQK